MAFGAAGRTKPLVAVADNGPIHASRLAAAALAERPRLTIEGLPKYASELNAIGPPGETSSRHQLATRACADADDLDRAIHDAVGRLNRERQPHPSATLIKAA